MSETREWSDEEWQLDQAVMDAEEIRPSGQVARLRAIREEWPKLHATVAALTAENERLTQENADLRSFYDHVTDWAERRLAARAALPSSRETSDPPPDKTREIL